jgi:Zn-dependent M32 family carboxypeptidase
MTNQELFSQAIADAKAVRDAAVANAKAALEETFTPRIMDMLSAKLNELEEEGLEEKKEVEEEGHEAAIGYGAAMQKPTIEGEMEEGDSMEETDLEEILAQLEAEEKMKEGKKEVEEAKDEVEEGKKDMEEAKKEVEEAKKKDDDKKKVEESLKEADDDDEMTELTVDELKDIIRDVLKDVLAGTEEEEGEGDIDLGDEAGAEAGEEEEVEDEESISLDELLAELDKEEGKKPVEEKKEVEEAKKEVEEGKKDMEEAKKEVEEAKKDLEEAIKTIKTLQSELNEVNLLNAKLLYTNKIFKAKSLNEAQKVKVLKAFDKATNVKDVKTVYNTLSESLTIRTKSTIKESVGFASKAAGVAPKQPIVEGDAAIRRMQQLAGIIK